LELFLLWISEGKVLIKKIGIIQGAGN